jgi:hypothetical protein
MNDIRFFHLNIPYTGGSHLYAPQIAKQDSVAHMLGIRGPEDNRERVVKPSKPVFEKEKVSREKEMDIALSSSSSPGKATHYGEIDVVEKYRSIRSLQYAAYDDAKIAMSRISLKKNIDVDHPEKNLNSDLNIPWTPLPGQPLQRWVKPSIR